MTAGRDEVIAEIADDDRDTRLAVQRLMNHYRITNGDELYWTIKELQRAAIREALSRVGGREADGWFLPSSEVNSIQVATINKTIKRAKHAHYVDARIRINGEYEFAQADWIKHMEAALAARQGG